jgi:hypothetical protein
VSTRPSSIAVISGVEIFEPEVELAANLRKAMIVAWAMTKVLFDACKERAISWLFSHGKSLC